MATASPTKLTSSTGTKPRSARLAPARGKLEWRAMLGWLREDGLIGTDDAEAVTKRFGGADSSQHPLVRLGSAGLAQAKSNSNIQQGNRDEISRNSCDRYAMEI